MGPKPTIPIVFSNADGTDFVDPATLDPVMFTKPQFIKGVCLGFGDMIADHEVRIRAIRMLLESVFWICGNPACGAPNQTPRILYPGLSTVNVCLRCPECQWIQSWDYALKFLPVVE